MVCLGNICRSPLAEGIMQHQASNKGFNWQIDSAGTGNWHIGEGPDRRSTKAAANHGLDISNQICRQFQVSDFDQFDRIYVMDRNNLSDVLALARNEADAAKVRLLLGNREVPDPYYDDTQFEPVYQLIWTGCEDLIKELSNETGKV